LQATFINKMNLRQARAETLQAKLSLYYQ